MKILWITEFFPESDKGEITGGVESRCFYVSRYLRKLGHDVKIISRKTTGENWNYYEFSSIPARVFYLISAFVKGLKEDTDLVEGSNFITFPIAWILGQIKRVPVVYWYPDVYIGLWPKYAGAIVGTLLNIWDQIILKLPGVNFIAISEETKKKLINQGVSSEKITVIPCGVETEEINKLPLPKIKKYDIISASRLLAYKRTEDLVQAVNSLKNDLPDIKCLIIGRGPMLQNLKDLTAKFNLKNNISFESYIPKHQTLLKTLASGKIFCLCSETEGFGITTIEAAALGLPYVISNIPVHKEVTRNGQGGFLFKTANISDLTAKLKTLLQNPEEYKIKSQEAKKLASNYNWTNIAKETLKYYENLHKH